MFPIRDHNPSRQTPYVTYALIAINVVVFISYWSLFADQRALQLFFYDWAMTPALVSQQGNYATLFTSMFLHGGLMHLAGNMLFLYIFGDNLEDEMGHLGYTLFYIASGLGAGLAHLAAAPYSQVPTVGASGAIAGVMGGYLLLFPKARVDVLLIFIVFVKLMPVPAWLMLAIWFGLQLFSGIGSDPTGGGVAYWAHAGGFVIGLILAVPVFLKRGGPAFWQRTAGEPPHAPAQYQFRRSDIPRVRRRK